MAPTLEKGLLILQLRPKECVSEELALTLKKGLPNTTYVPVNVSPKNSPPKKASRMINTPVKNPIRPLC